MRITPAHRDRTTADWKNIGWWSVNERYGAIRQPAGGVNGVQGIFLARFRLFG